MSAGPRARLLVVGTVAAGVVGVLAAAGLGDTLAYYRTPTEVLAVSRSAPDERLRVGGLVLAGTLQRSAQAVRFTLTDGVRELPVEHRGTAPGVLQEGQGAVVEGRLGAGGVLLADTVLVKHSNEYQRAERPGAA